MLREVYIDPDGKKPKMLLPTSGIVNVLSLPTTGGIRAMFVFKDFLYAVSDSNVYKIDSSFVATQINISPLTTSGGYVGIDANTFQIIFVDGQKGYIYDTISGLFEQITDPSFPSAPIDVCYLDGFFVCANGGTNEFRLSQINQGLVWGNLTNAFTVSYPLTPTLLNIPGSAIYYQTGTPVEVSVTGGTLPAPLQPNTTYYSIFVDSGHISLSLTNGGAPITLTNAGTGTFSITNNGSLQSAFITSHPGNIVACRTLHRRLFLFSSNYTEVWENAGFADFPFRRNNSVLIEFGTISAKSIKAGFDRMFFLSRDKDGLGPVMMVSGVQAIPISNSALDYQIQQYNSPSDCDVALYKENGIIFYRLNFSDDNHTYVYNATMSTIEKPLWHEEEMLNGDRSVMGVNANFNLSNYFGDYKSPIIYYSDDSILDNANEEIKRTRITRNLVLPNYQGINVNRLQIDLVQGDVDNIPDNIAPIVFLSISKDGGISYGNELPASMGKIGERTFRTVWRKLGTVRRGQGLIFKITFYNRIKFVILGAAWDYEVMPE
jgi:hypothetical protein